jgi:hypothetical protein
MDLVVGGDVGSADMIEDGIEFGLDGLGFGVEEG